MTLISRRFTDFVVEGARDGRSVADLMEAGAKVLTRDRVMSGISEMIHDVRSKPPSQTAPSRSPSRTRFGKAGQPYGNPV
jgi:hypothetical protein